MPVVDQRFRSAGLWSADVGQSRDVHFAGASHTMAFTHFALTDHLIEPVCFAFELLRGKMWENAVVVFVQIVAHY